MMITVLEKCETQRKLLTACCNLVASLLIVWTRVGGGGQYGGKDDNGVERETLSSRSPHWIKIIETLDDRRLSRRTYNYFEWKRFTSFTVNKTLRWGIACIFYVSTCLHRKCYQYYWLGIEMLLFENSVLKIHLLNTQWNFHIKSFNYFILFICFIKQFVGSIW
jgi:hypothetical protein